MNKDEHLGINGNFFNFENNDSFITINSLIVLRFSLSFKLNFTTTKMAAMKDKGERAGTERRSVAVV